MTKKYILALDQGTSSSRTVIFDLSGKPLAQVSMEFKQIYPFPGWVEHDPAEIWDSQLYSLKEVLRRLSVAPGDIIAAGITNQRETTILWDRETGRPVYNAIVWQCRRTADICDMLRETGYESMIRERTGLLIDAYFSATKIKWILDNVEGARKRAENGELCFGTVDTWLAYNLTGGKAHLTDYSNASRTMLYNIKKKCWDEEILRVLDIPASLMPEVRSSSGNFGDIDAGWTGKEIPISGIAGDQQASLFGQGCFEAGMAKNTYGTGCFLLMNTGSDARQSGNGLLTTLACGAAEKVDYVIEGSVFIAGAAIQWLRDEMHMISDVSESEKIAQEIPDNAGVYFVPAFVGLGAPHWDMHARGTIVGLTRGSGRAHIVRAAIESVAYQVKDVVIAMEEETGIKLKELRVDGGAVANSFLMQFQADILGVPVVLSTVAETTALGAAYLAGLANGVWRDINEISLCRREGKRYLPGMDKETVDRLDAGWRKAVATAKGWANMS